MRTARTAVVRARVTPQQRQQLDRVAAARGVRMSVLVRELLAETLTANT